MSGSDPRPVAAARRLSGSGLVPLLGFALVLAVPLGACHRGEPGAAGPATLPAGEALLAARFPGRDPSLRWDRKTASLHVAYVEDAAGGPRIVYRRLGENATGPVSVSPAGTAVSSHAEVPPAIEALADGTLLVAYTVSLPGKWKGEIRLQRSTDGGRSWSAAVPLQDDGGRAGSRSFFDVTTGSRGEAVFAWLDDRAGQPGLVVARTADGRAVGSNRVVDPQTCQCCRTALLAGGDGRLWIAYRELDARSVRDIALVSSADGGATFGEPALVSADGWELEGCPHSGPRLALDESQRLWVAWFTGAEPGVYAAVSGDGGRTFGPRELVAGVGGDLTAVGHPEIGALPDGRLAVVYETARQQGGRALEVRSRTSSDGRWTDPVRVALDAVYPRLARRGKNAALAWTVHAGQGGAQVEVVDWRRALGAPPA
jgi:hypothetical protein